MKQFLKILVSGVISSILFAFLYFIYFTLKINTWSMPEFLAFLAPDVIGIVLIGTITFIAAVIIYFAFSDQVISNVKRVENIVEASLGSMNLADLILSTVGGITGLFIGNLVSKFIATIPVIGVVIATVATVLCGYLGYKAARARKEDVKHFFSKTAKIDKNVNKVYGRPKVLDTSVIIDGRILDILKTGFIEGKLIIPNFVLEELRRIADSSDSLKRNRGRRGLDILNEIQNQSDVPVEIIDWDPKDIEDVDTKLLKVGKKLDAFVVTNDFNLNKVAEFQKVSVLNINDLSRSVKTVVLPGETMKVTIIKDGKENKQGIAYLEDGTMIVIENGNKHIGETTNVTVTSVLQTSAGRMIFAKMKDEKIKVHS